MDTIKPAKKPSRKKKEFKTVTRVGKRGSQGFEKAWAFWKTAQLDLSNFKFNREEANAR